MVDQLNAFSVLLVFISLIFLHIEKEAKEFLKLEKPPKNVQVKAHKLWKVQKQFLIFKSTLALLFCFFVWYVTVPDLLEILKTSDLNLLTFDALKTSYIILSFSLMAIWLVIVRWMFLLTKK